MAKRCDKNVQKSKDRKEKERTIQVRQPLSEQKISLQESISKLENKLLEDDVKNNDRAKFAINKMIAGFKERLKKA
jgi:hypothetical protein